MKRLLKVAAVLGTVHLVRRAMRGKGLDLAGRVVAITGGSRGLGLVLARTLVARGARVAICARDARELMRAREDLEKRGGTIYSSTCDVTDRDDVLAFVAGVEDDFGPIDALINNAGVIQVGPIESMTIEDFDRALDVNLRGPLNAMLAVIPKMRRRHSGRIVNIASVGGKIGIPHLAPYCTSKFALVGLSESMRTELVKDGIVVTTVCPGLMRTGSPRQAWFKGDAANEYAWFSAGDSLAMTSVSAERAAEQIVDALQRGDAELVISPQAKVATFAAAVAPSLVQYVLGMVARLLPKATESRASIQGKDLETRSRWTRRSDAAARRNNEN